MPELDISRDVLFIGMGQSALLYYRVMLPAIALGADWIGVHGEPPKLTWMTGLAKDESGEPQSNMPDLFRYKVIVIQQPAGKGWLDTIDALRESGVKVIYEVDDYVHGIKHLDDHDFREQFGNDYLAKAEAAMKRCDALIASTEWIRGNYSHFNKRAYVCRNGIDLGRYALTKPKRESVNVGWAGATGHQRALVPWLQTVAAIMRMRENVCFVSIGQPFALGFQQHFGEERAIAIPWAAIEQYPAAMTMLDVALAPAGPGGWWRGKSDLRWLEAGSLGIPLIANPYVYPEIKHGVTGFHAQSQQDVAEILTTLLNDEDLRTKVGESAKEHIAAHRDIHVVAEEWRKVIEEVAAS